LELENTGSWRFLQVGACKLGVGASFQLELENSGSCSFLQVGACKQGVGSSFQLVLDNLEVGASYECNILIYKKALCGFLPFGFPHKILVYCVFDVICYALLNGHC
jgi:hypothetical protein